MMFGDCLEDGLEWMGVTAQLSWFVATTRRQLQCLNFLQFTCCSKRVSQTATPFIPMVALLSANRGHYMRARNTYLSCSKLPPRRSLEAIIFFIQRVALDLIPIYAMSYLEHTLNSTSGIA